MSRAEQRGAAGLQQRQPQQQRQPPQRSESPAPHGEEGGQLGRLLREAAPGSRGNPLLFGTVTLCSHLMAAGQLASIKWKHSKEVFGNLHVQSPKNLQTNYSFHLKYILLYFQV